MLKLKNGWVHRVCALIYERIVGWSKTDSKGLFSKFNKEKEITERKRKEEKMKNERKKESLRELSLRREEEKERKRERERERERERKKSWKTKQKNNISYSPYEQSIMWVLFISQISYHDRTIKERLISGLGGLVGLWATQIQVARVIVPQIKSASRSFMI